METPNHGYEVPGAGESDWHEPINGNFQSLDTDVEVRGPAAKRGDYDAKPGAKYFATDTGDVYVGRGGNWERLGSVSEAVNSTRVEFDGKQSPHVHVAETAGDIQPIVDTLDGTKTGTTAGGKADAETPSAGVVKLQRGVYRVSSPIELKRGVHLEGVQRGTLGSANAGVTGPDFSVVEPASDFPDGKPLVRSASEDHWSLNVRNLVLRGTSDSSGVHGIQIDAANCQVQGVRTHSLGGNDLWTRGAKDLKVWNSSLGRVALESENGNVGSGSYDTQARIYNCQIGQLFQNSALVWVFESTLGAREPGITETALVGEEDGAKLYNSVVTGAYDRSPLGVDVREGVALVNVLVENRSTGIRLDGKRKTNLFDVGVRNCVAAGIDVVNAAGSLQRIHVRNVGKDEDGTVVQQNAHGIDVSGSQPVAREWTNVRVDDTTGYALKNDSIRQQSGPRIVSFQATGTDAGAVSNPSLVQIAGHSVGYDIRSEGTATLSGDGQRRVFEVSGFSLDDDVAHAEVHPDVGTDAVAVDGVRGDSFGPGSFEFAFASAPPSGTDNVAVTYRVAAEAALEQESHR